MTVCNKEKNAYVQENEEKEIYQKKKKTQWLCRWFPPLSFLSTFHIECVLLL